MPRHHLLSLGHGYTARALAAALPRDDWRITGTTRKAEALDEIAATGVEAVQWPGTDMTEALADATHVLSSVPPRDAGDPAYDVLAAHLGRMPRLQWVGLLSTTGVYGDQGGDWVDEDTPLVPATHRGGLRATQNEAWMKLWEEHGLPVHVFRLAGIYGPGRSAFDKLRAGTARRIVKSGQVFSRIHVEDIVQVLLASIAHPHPGRAYNVADDAPCPPQDVIETAAKMLGVPVPPDLTFEEADLSPMARSFYADNKRVSNARIKSELGVTLRYPDHHAGLKAILAVGA